MLRKHYDFQDTPIVLMRKLWAKCMEAVPSQPYPQSSCRAQKLTRSMCCCATCAVSSLLHSVFQWHLWVCPSDRHLAKSNTWRNFMLGDYNNDKGAPKFCCCLFYS